MSGGVRVAVPTETVVKTKLAGGERADVAHPDEEGGADHIVFFHGETVDPVDQNQSSDG
jgi:hypothetical protein